MPAPSKKQDILIIAGLLVLGLLIAAAGHYSSSSVSRHMLSKHATEAADLWFRHLESVPEDVKKIADGKGASKAILDASANLRHFTHIVRYEIFSPKGDLVYSSGKIRGATVPPLAAEFLIEKGERVNPANLSKLHLFTSDDVGKPEHYAAVLRPLIHSGKHIGSILTYIDQTHQMKILSSAFNLVAAATIVLLLVAMSAPIIVIGFKIRDRWKAEEHIRYLAHYDPLTGLANRVTFNDKLTDALMRRERTEEKIAVMFLDLDRFKEVNDTLGHSVGDALLVEFASRLKKCVRNTDIISRLSGDEFAIALLDIQDTEQVRKSVSRIFNRMALPFKLEGHDVNCSVSIGIAIGPEDGKDTNGLLKCADMALYNAKDDGRNTSSFFHNEMDELLQHRRKIETELRHALANDEFEMYFQPQYDLQSGEMSGCESLIRWNHPELGTVAPGHFISIAEESGLIVPIGEWTLRAACKTAAGWSKPYKVAVNVSPVQFRRTNVVALVQDVLAETGLPANRLELEITEAILMADTDKVMEELSNLRELGISIAMDDFGTGYSSLGYLSRFVFDKIKIDRSFMKDIESEGTATAIISTIITLGNSLGMSIVAEGVETQKQADYLRELDCGYVQGYFFGRPMPASAYEELVDAPPSSAPKAATQMKVA